MNIFRAALQSWIDTWEANKLLFFVELFGTLLGMISSIILNVMAANPPMLFILIFYVISAWLLAYSSYIRRSPFMFVLMIFYSVSSMLGLVHLIF